MFLATCVLGIEEILGSQSDVNFSVAIALGTPLKRGACLTAVATGRWCLGSGPCHRTWMSRKGQIPSQSDNK